MIIAGPLESSRLGRTVAIQNVPCRQCTYSCLYCGLGGTERLRTRRRPFHTAEGVVDAVLRVLDRAPERVAIDHLSFQAGGEPTLDTHLGVEIRGLREAAIPIAVLTNASLLWRGDVRDELLAADLVSLKLDTADAETWRRLNRPGRQLRLGRILGGVAGFAESFGGLLHTETTLVPGVNDDPEQLASLAAFLAALRPERVSLFAAGGDRDREAESLERARSILGARLPRVVVPAHRPEAPSE